MIILDFAELTPEEIAYFGEHSGDWRPADKIVPKRSAREVTRQEVMYMKLVILRCPVFASPFLNGPLVPDVLRRVRELGCCWADIPVSIVFPHDYLRFQAREAAEPVKGDFFFDGFTLRWSGGFPL